MTIYGAHIITDDAVALGDPSITVLAYDDPDDPEDAGEFVADYPIPAGVDPETVLAEHGWGGAHDWSTVDVGYHVCRIEPRDWVTVIEGTAFDRAAAQAELDRREQGYRIGIRDAVLDGVPAREVAAAAGVTSARVYQIRDDRR